jgi:hemoglobin
LTTQPQQRDLDSRENIEAFVDLFLAVHLPHIKDYWCKLLLGEKHYQRHTMNIHRQLHGKQPLQAGDFQRWLALFNATLDEGFAGERAERARQVAASIAGNMEASLPAKRR